MPSVSLTMIVRDEETALPDALRCVADLVDDVVVVDTGSTDRTREAAAAVCPGARIFDFPWCDDFSAARNEALRHARGEWIFWIDADDRIDEAGRAKLRDLFARLPAADSPGDGPNPIFTMPYVSHTPWCEGLAPVVPYQRLFRNRPDIRWVGRVFETVQSTNPHLGATNVPIDIPVTHFGYADLRQFVHKLQRNRRLFLLEQAELSARLEGVAFRLRQTDETLPIYERLVQIETQLGAGGDAQLAHEQRQLLWRLAHPQGAPGAAELSTTTVIVG